MAKKKTKIDQGVLERASVVVDEIERLTEERRAFYDEHDALAEKLEKVSPEVLIVHRLVLEKPFEKGNTQWGHGPVRRLKLSRAKPGKKSADK